jgi:hypothetical protein
VHLRLWGGVAHEVIYLDSMRNAKEFFEFDATEWRIDDQSRSWKYSWPNSSSCV